MLKRSSVVEAAEDYITPEHIFNKNTSDKKHYNLTSSTHLKPVDTSRQTKEAKFKDKTCYKCKRTGNWRLNVVHFQVKKNNV